MGHTPIQRYRFFSICWNIIYIFFAIVHIPVIALLLHFAPSVHLSIDLIVENPIVIAFPLANFFVIICLCSLGIVGLLFSIQLKCCMSRILSMVILGVQASLSLLFVLLRGAIVACCVRSIYHLSTEYPLPTSTPSLTTASDSIELTTEVPIETSYLPVFLWFIIALFLMILSAITELIQAIFSSLVLHQVRLENEKVKQAGKSGNYMKMDTKAEIV